MARLGYGCKAQVEALAAASAKPIRPSSLLKIPQKFVEHFLEPELVFTFAENDPIISFHLVGSRSLGSSGVWSIYWVSEFSLASWWQLL